MSHDLEREPQGQEPATAAIRAMRLQATALHQQGRFAEAEQTLREILAQEPDCVDALHELGIILVRWKKYEAAIELIGRAIALKPDSAEAYSDYAMAMRKLGRPAEALANYDKAIALQPGFAMAFNNRANALLDLKRPGEALASCDRAIALKPNFALAHFNRGVALNHLGRFDDAVLSFDKAIALQPDLTFAHENRGHSLNHMKRYEEATAAYERAYRLDPHLTGVEGSRLFTKMRICDWIGFDSECAHLIASVRGGNASTSPFPFVAIASTSSEQLECAKLWVAANIPSRDMPGLQGNRNKHDRIRIGYFSADFHSHATGHLMAGLFEGHDKSRFESIAFSFGPDDNSEMRRRITVAFDRFIDVRNQSDRDVAMQARELEIDIAVDLKGYTTDSRTGIFAFRAAPIQISYLGYPGTMGAEYFDYLIADRTLIPPAERKCYSEKIIYLPNSYQVNDRKRAIVDKRVARNELGLPDEGFVFCCFNNNYKIAPEMFDRWMRILKRIDDSVLWLFEDNASAAGNLRREAGARGVNPERLVFAKLVPLPEHLARHTAADLFLDTLPYNAHTTASDALWAGLPVLTQVGETFAGRVAASLLRAIDMPELITASAQGYEELAIELATSPDKLAAIRRKLAENRLTTPLFDTELFTKHIEVAYTAVYERYREGLPPDHIDVQQLSLR